MVEYGIEIVNLYSKIDLIASQTYLQKCGVEVSQVIENLASKIEEGSREVDKDNSLDEFLSPSDIQVLLWNFRTLSSLYL